VISMQTARIKLSGKDPKILDQICREIIEIAKKFGVGYRGPIPLPTKRLRVVTLKTPCGDGTGHGNATFDKWEMRIHKRVIDLQADDRALRQIMRINVPHGVHIEIKLLKIKKEGKAQFLSQKTKPMKALLLILFPKLDLLVTLYSAV